MPLTYDSPLVLATLSLVRAWADGVTKADVILWLLRAGRDVCMSDVDAAWIATPYALLRSVPQADVLSGTDCLNVPFDADRSHRAQSTKK